MAYSIHSKVRLQDKVDSCWHRISNHRTVRERIWKAYIGDTHGLSAPGADRIPLNGHALYARSLIHYLAAHQPKLLISTDVGPWKAHTESVEFQASRVMREQRFGFKQQRWVLDALLYSPGVLKVCREFVRVPQGDEGDYAEVLRTVVANVDGSDVVYDTAGSSWWDCGFVGHKVRTGIDDVMANPLFAHVPEERLRGMAGGTMGDEGRLFFEDDDKSQPYRETVSLWEIYDRCSDRLIIFPVDGSDLVLYDEPWDGHPNGPLHPLDFLDVPNHVVGLSPLCILHDLIEATNRALSKTIKQTDVAKTIMRIVGGNRSEAEAVMQAFDGQAVFQDGGGTAEMMTVGGPDARTMAMVPILKDLYNWLGGNINELAGLGVSAPTATQGKLLSEAASGMVNFMQARTQEAVRQVAEAIVYNELKDDIGTESVPRKLADGQTHWKKFTPEMRQQIDAVLVNVNIDVFSMRYRSPEQRLEQLMTWWTQFAVPGYQIWQQQGGEYDIQALMRTYAKYADMPEINDVALYSMGPQPESAGTSGPVAMKQSPVTTRTNVRLDSGGPSSELGGDMAANMMKMGAAA